MKNHQPFYGPTSGAKVIIYFESTKIYKQNCTYFHIGSLRQSPVNPYLPLNNFS